MDVSNSMLDDKNNLVKLTSSLVETSTLNYIVYAKCNFGLFLTLNVLFSEKFNRRFQIGIWFFY